MNLRTILCAAGLVLAGCATATTPPDPSAITPRRALSPAEQRGRDYAVFHCASCHDVGLGAPASQNGPAFRALARRTNPVSLERRFTEIPQHRLDNMPPTPMTASEAEDLVAYLQALQDR